VLLASLQGEAISGTAFGVVRNTDETSGHVAFVLVARCEKGGMRSAESERNTETLRASDRDIGAEFAGWL
jgi:predicted transcriptional regulator